jgi:methylthioribose-1-phosphate isomerase
LIPAPEPNRKFKPIELNPARFDQSWDRKRGAAVRLTSVLLRHDEVTLESRVCENAKTAKTYADAADWLQRESEYLRKIARLLETASGRLSVVLTRCQTREFG